MNESGMMAIALDRIERNMWAAGQRSAQQHTEVIREIHSINRRLDKLMSQKKLKSGVPNIEKKIKRLLIFLMPIGALLLTGDWKIAVAVLKTLLGL